MIYISHLCIVVQANIHIIYITCRCHLQHKFSWKLYLFIQFYKNSCKLNNFFFPLKTDAALVYYVETEEKRVPRLALYCYGGGFILKFKFFEKLKQFMVKKQVMRKEHSRLCSLIDRYLPSFTVSSVLPPPDTYLPCLFLFLNRTLLHCRKLVLLR